MIKMLLIPPPNIGTGEGISGGTSESYYEISMASEENEGCLRKLVEEVKRLNLSAEKS